MRPSLRDTRTEAGRPPGAKALDKVFAALADPVRREILSRLDDGEFVVGELAAPFPMSLQAVSKHIRVLVDAGLVRQQRAGRLSRCRLDAGPMYQAAVWVNRYSRYWQDQFDTLAAVLAEAKPMRPKPRTARRSKSRSKSRMEEPS